MAKVLTDSLNLSSELAMGLSLGGLQLSSNPGSGTFNLGDLNRHNAIEHDASLSRKDFSVDGDSRSFSEEIFCEFLGYFGNDKNLTIANAATARW